MDADAAALQSRFKTALKPGDTKEAINLFLDELNLPCHLKDNDYLPPRYTCTVAQDYGKGCGTFVRVNLDNQGAFLDAKVEASRTCL